MTIQKCLNYFQTFRSVTLTTKLKVWNHTFHQTFYLILQTTFKYELVEELKFALKFSGDVKPVKRPSKTVDGSTENIADIEGKDELKSLKSLKSNLSGRSTSTHRTHHSHSSRHSSMGLSVAFAKRRSYS